MDLSPVEIIGSALGEHGPNTFYKAFKYEKDDGMKRIVQLGDFFFVKLWSDSDLMCIGELLLLWYDRNSEQVLSSLRLYFLPENTAEGRIDHGEDEVLAISEKVILRLEDLVSWITLSAEWTWGQVVPFDEEFSDPTPLERSTPITRLTDRMLDLKEVVKEKEILLQEQGEDKSTGPTVLILSFPAYCRYRAVMKRMEGVEDIFIQSVAVQALAGVKATNKNTRVLFCRDTFDYPELEGHELLCNDLAPKLTGRPRVRRKKRSVSPGSDSNDSECSVSNLYNTAQASRLTEENPNGLYTTGICTRRSSRLVVTNSESKEFLKKLTIFMQLNDTPMGRIPSLGYKELDLHAFFIRVDKLGGYEAVTTNRLWKSIFDDLSGNYISTSAATVIRRHYERFLLPYELYLKGEEFHPSMLKSAIKKTKSSSSNCSEADINDNTSCTSMINTTISTNLNNPMSSSSSQLTIIPLPPPIISNDTTQNLQEPTKIRLERKPSSLRNVRVKADRFLKDTSQKIPLVENIKNDPIVIQSESLLQKAASAISITPPSGLTVELVTSKSSLSEDSTLPCITSHPSISVTISKPPEGKENIATCNTSSSGLSISSEDTNVNNVEVPYRSKTPEPEISYNNIIKTNCFSNSLLSSVKKRKLEILKEGGLEVTPVKPSIIDVRKIKDSRPSVIHKGTVPRATIGQLSITLTTDKANEKLKEVPSSTNAFLYGNDKSPPKILQSSSIYSHSERTVYGNPKDYFTPPAPHTPRSINRSIKHTGGDILDLTFKSPQKPVLEMMQLPKELHRRVSKPNLDNSPRLSSNLEITLVAPPNKLINSKPQSRASRRPTSSNLNTQHRKHQNGTKLPYNVTPTSQLQANVHREHRLSSSHNGQTPKQPVNTNLKSFANIPSAATANLYSQLSLVNKMLPPYVPPMDPLYLSAMQSLYSQGQSFLPIPTPEQIQFYTELMTRNSQIPRFPFPYPQDTKSCISNKSVNSETLKK